MGTSTSDGWSQALVVGQDSYRLWGNPLPDGRAEWHVMREDGQDRAVTRGERGSQTSAMRTAEAVARALSAGVPAPPDDAKAVDPPCPVCGVTALHFEDTLQAKRIGEFSLSGAQMKVSASGRLHLVCRACKAEAAATRVAGGTVEFNPAAMAVPGAAR